MIRREWPGWPISRAGASFCDGKEHVTAESPTESVNFLRERVAEESLTSVGRLRGEAWKCR